MIISTFKKLFLLALFCLVSIFSFAEIDKNNFLSKSPILADPLTSGNIVKGEINKTSTKGEFTKKGWRANANEGMLLIELENAQGFEGALKIDITGLDWYKANTAAGKDSKIHFLNMFSNFTGDHHIKDGGTSADAFWTLRAGATKDGQPRYGNNFKILWASKGAKGTDHSDYEEINKNAPLNWRWDKNKTYTFNVTWSKSKGTWTVTVNNQLFYSGDWKNQITPLKYIFLGKAADFSSFQGPYYSNLKVYGVKEAGKLKLKKGFYFPPKGNESLAVQNVKKPEEVGLSTEIINALKPVGGVKWALWRHGYLVHCEGNFNEETEMASLRKTYHAMTVGAAIKQGKIPSIHQKVSTYETQLKGNDAVASWRHLIIQAAGFDYPGCGDTTDYKPGQMWTYSDLNLRILCNALAKVYGKKDFFDNYKDVVKEAFFDDIGMAGYNVVYNPIEKDGPRFEFDLEDMGRLGLLALARGKWEGKEIIPQWFIEELETQQTAGMKVNYKGCNDGMLPFDPKDFPEVPYGYMTWNNTGGKNKNVKGADEHWAFAAGKGNTRIFWNRTNGIVLVGVNTNDGVAKIIDENIKGPNPFFE